MKRKTMALLFACVLVGALSIAAWRPATRASISPQPSTNGSTGGISEQVANLSAKVEELERTLAAMKQQGAQRSNQPPSTNPLPEPSAPQNRDVEIADARAKREQENEKFHEYMAVVAKSFEREKLDPAWSHQATSRVAAAFEADNALHDVATDVQCRERTCRVQIDDTDRKVSARMPSIATQLGDVLPNISADRIDQGNGRSALVLYMTANEFPRVSPVAK